MQQEDKFIKFTKLYILIFLLFLAVPVTIALVLAAFYNFSKLIASRPADMFFELLIVAMPVAIFATAYVIFFRRTRYHPAKTVRVLSYLIFIAGLCGCMAVLVMDFYSFFTVRGRNITDYHSFSLLFIAGNVAALFITAIIQAFTTEKERDWMDRLRD